MAALDDVGEVAEEEGQQQRADVAAVHVGIGHDDDTSVAQTFEIEVIADTGSQRGDERLDFVVAENFIEAGAFGVEDLTAQRQDRLEVTVASLFGGAACRVTFHDVEFRFG